MVSCRLLFPTSQKRFLLLRAPARLRRKGREREARPRWLYELAWCLSSLDRWLKRSVSRKAKVVLLGCCYKWESPSKRGEQSPSTHFSQHRLRSNEARSVQRGAYLQIVYLIKPVARRRVKHQDALGRCPAPSHP